MTDKQIIIDDVDVSGCKHYKNRNCIADYCLTDMPFSEVKCELNPNCHYKQLKQKEQECEELKKDRERWKSNFNGKVSAIEELLKQLDQLKQTLAEIKDIAENINTECFYDDFDCKDCDMKNGCTYQEKIKILQKISEYKGEYNEKSR